MALSKLAVGLIAGIGSVVAVGGITAGVVVSSNRNTVSKEVENKTESKEEKKPSVTENRHTGDMSVSNQINNEIDATSVKEETPENKQDNSVDVNVQNSDVDNENKDNKVDQLDEHKATSTGLENTNSEPQDPNSSHKDPAIAQPQNDQTKQGGDGNNQEEKEVPVVMAVQNPEQDKNKTSQPKQE